MSASQIENIQGNIPNLLGDSFNNSIVTTLGGVGTLSQFDDTISLSPGGGTVNVGQMPTITTLVTNTTGLSYDAGLLVTTIDGDLHVTNGNIQAIAAGQGIIKSNNLELYTLSSEAMPTNLLSIDVSGAVHSTPALGYQKVRFSDISWNAVGNSFGSYIGTISVPGLLATSQVTATLQLTAGYSNTDVDLATSCWIVAESTDTATLSVIIAADPTGVSNFVCISYHINKI